MVRKLAPGPKGEGSTQQDVRQQAEARAGICNSHRHVSLHVHKPYSFHRSPVLRMP